MYAIEISKGGDLADIQVYVTFLIITIHDLIKSTSLNYIRFF